MTLTTVLNSMLSDNPGILDRGGRKNFIINGDMRVAQRSTSETGVGNANQYEVHDRWRHDAETFGTGRYTLTQDSSGPDGFASSMKIDCTTADVSIASNVQQLFTQRIEAQDLQHLAWGTSSAKTLTLSFWVYSSQTGTMSVLLRAPDDDRSYHQNYTINSTNTWEKKVLVYLGDTAGTINNDSGIGLHLYFPITSGSNFQGGTTGSWATHANNMYGTNTTINVLGSTDNEYRITGIQLELGSVATDFEHLGIREQTADCHRYLWRWNMQNERTIQVGYTTTTTNTSFGVYFRELMRAQPTLTNSGNHLAIEQNGFGTGASNITLGSIDDDFGGAAINITHAAATANDEVRVFANNSSSWLQFDAEL